MPPQLHKGVLIRPSILSSTHANQTQPRTNTTLPSTRDYVAHPTPTPLASALQHYIDSDDPSPGRTIHARILKMGFQPNTNVSIKLLILYVKSNCMRYARQMFDEMPHPTLSAYNYLISGYIKHSRAEESLGMVRKLMLSNEKPDGFTYSMILKASTVSSAGAAASPWLSRGMGKEVHAQILKCDVDLDDVLCTTLVNSYVKSQEIDYARTLFNSLSAKDVACSTAMITGYMNQGSIGAAEDVFRKTIPKDVVVFNAMIEGYSKCTESGWKSLNLFIEMQRLTFRPTISTFASVIGACSLLAAFETGQQVHTQIMKTQHFKDIRIGSALIDMYSKCGRTNDARMVFDHMLQKNVFSWTSMIDGYGKNGSPHDAIELFRRMEAECHITPNYVTFLAALSACGHAGLVNEGKQIFESMERIYSVKPAMEHYACMVDLFGRAGSLQEAWEFVMGMPEKPNIDVWATLLSACKMHGDVEIARIAADELFRLNSEERPGAYLALSNTLAEAGKWDNVSEVRELMKVRGVSKEIGLSWVGSE